MDAVVTKVLGQHAPAIVIASAKAGLRNALSTAAGLPTAKGYFEVKGFTTDPDDGTITVQIEFEHEVLMHHGGADLLMQGLITADAVEECGVNHIGTTGWVRLA